MERDKTTKQPIHYYNKLPEKFDSDKEIYVYICDPMLATGGSAIDAIKLYVKDRNIPRKKYWFY